MRDFPNSGTEPLIIEFLPKFRMAPGDTFCQEADELAIDIIAAQPGIAVRGQDAKNALAEFENGNVKSSTAEVVNSDPRTVIESIQTVGKCCGSRFIDNSFDRKPCQFPSSLCR